MKLTMFTGAYPVGDHLGGIGLRLWEIALVLTDAGVEVTMACPPGSDESWSRPNLRVQIIGDEEATWAPLVDTADAVLSTDLPDARVLLRAHELEKLQITENAIPVEHLDYAAVAAALDPQEGYDDLRDTFLLQSWLSDHFLARSSVERAGMLGALTAIGRLGPAHHAWSRTLEHLLTLVPIGFAAASAAVADWAVASRPPTELAWTGGVWDFSDTAALTSALATLRDRGQPVRVRFLHPPPAGQRIAETGRLRQAVDRLDLTGLVAYPDAPLPHPARDGVIRSSKVLVCFGRDGTENHTCHRLRLRDTLLYRLPVVIDAYGASGDWVRQSGVGLVVDTRRPGEVADAIAALTFDPAVYRHCQEAIDAVRPAHALERTVAPLLAVLRAGRRAPDAGSARQQAALEQLLHRRPALTTAPRNPF